MAHPLMIKLLCIALVGVLVLPSATSAEKDTASLRTPVLVELFTSEGCSSCPPADKFLQDIDAQQPVAGADLIVLSEHVDYWNHDGWKDPFSSRSITERQGNYSAHFKIDSVYTPQMIVDGDAQFVGNSPATARTSFERAAAVSKIPVLLSSITLDGNTLRAHVSVAPLPSGERGRADVYVALALRHAESQVLKGENEGRRLSHVGVVRTMTKVGSVGTKQASEFNIELKLDPSDDPGNLKLVAFAQQPGPGKILGATAEQVKK
jgi:hypothetical protein